MEPNLVVVVVPEELVGLVVVVHIPLQVGLVVELGLLDRDMQVEMLAQHMQLLLEAEEQVRKEKIMRQTQAEMVVMEQTIQLMDHLYVMLEVEEGVVLVRKPVVMLLVAVGLVVVPEELESMELEAVEEEPNNGF